MLHRPAAAARRHGNDPDPLRRIRVGVVSGDLVNHAVVNFLDSMLPELDGEAIELFAYATTNHFDSTTDRLRQSIPNWRKVANYGDAKLAANIVEDNIDVLIDLAGHTANSRLPVFALKPAPVQLTWLGYSGTTGVPGMDYILADRHVAPEGSEGQFTETVWRLPDSYLCFSAPRRSPAVAPLPAAERGQLTFGCFNTINKLSAPAIALWAEVLRAVPESRLLLKNRRFSLADAREAIAQRFLRHGIAAARLELLGHVEEAEGHLATYGQVDIALDPFPYNGTTTSCEAMWMGVPVLTLRGDRFIARVGESLLRSIGLDEWVATDGEDFVRRARELSADLPALAQLRAGLRQRMAASPLMDAPRFAGNFEAALRGMWQNWCAAEGEQR
jgi:predicted O-linked N-acetylglucosamine transferase (SPINDLY family)